MIRAAGYVDEIAATSNRSLRFWFICLGGGGQWACMRMFCSKGWERKFDTPWCAGQKWSCNCGTNYKAKFGTVLELWDKGLGTFYYRGSCPDWDTLDMNAHRLQKSFKGVSPKDLFDSIPMCAPAETQVVEKVNDACWRVRSSELLAAMPKWDWADIYNFGKA